MVRGRNRLTFLLAMGLIIGLIAITVPVCLTTGCDMETAALPGPMEHIGHVGHTAQVAASSVGSVVHETCDMAATTARAVDRALPTELPTLLMGLMALMLVAATPLVPVPALCRALPFLGAPPDPPDDLRGVRLLN